MKSDTYDVVNLLRSSAKKVLPKKGYMRKCPDCTHALLHVRTAVALSTSVFCAQSDSGAENVDWLDWKCALQLAKRSVEAC